MRFGLPQREWQGPVACEFEYCSGHTKTARYRCEREEHAFDFYAPLFSLKGLRYEEVPERLQIVVWKSESPVRTCGYLSEPRPPCVESNVLEYEFTDEKVNSVRYDLVHEGQVYALYIPNGVFEGLPRPKRVYVQIAAESRH